MMQGKVIPLNAKQARDWPEGVISEAIKEKVKELPLMLSAKDLEGILPVNRTAIYELFKREDFPKIQIGKRLMTPTHLFFEFLEDEARKTG